MKCPICNKAMFNNHDYGWDCKTIVKLDEDSTSPHYWIDELNNGCIIVKTNDLSYRVLTDSFTKRSCIQKYNAKSWLTIIVMDELTDQQALALLSNIDKFMVLF